MTGNICTLLCSVSKQFLTQLKFLSLINLMMNNRVGTRVCDSGTVHKPVSIQGKKSLLYLIKEFILGRSTFQLLSLSKKGFFYHKSFRYFRHKLFPSSGHWFIDNHNRSRDTIVCERSYFRVYGLVSCICESLYSRVYGLVS